jgi:hypothetical protein
MALRNSPQPRCTSDAASGLAATSRKSRHRTVPNVKRREKSMHSGQPLHSSELAQLVFLARLEVGIKKLSFRHEQVQHVVHNSQRLAAISDGSISQAGPSAKQAGTRRWLRTRFPAGHPLSAKYTTASGPLHKTRTESEAHGLATKGDEVPKAVGVHKNK